jgi:citrate lyase subunit beta / citryl-CoA lyase
VRDRVDHARTLLFVPGDRPDRFAKAVASGADAVILDLEDAVDPIRKDEALDAVVDWLGSRRSDGGSALVRLDGERGERDLAAIAGSRGLVGVVVPKAEDPVVLEAIADALPSTATLIALIETAVGVSRAREIAAARGVRRLAVGTFDLSADLGADESSETIRWLRFELVLASRLAGLTPPIDTVTSTIGNGEAAGIDARRARSNGFGGKLCIHPVQVGPVSRAFRPTEAEVEEAGRIVAAADGEGAAAVDGRMIDRPILARARAVLADAATTNGRNR